MNSAPSFHRRTTVRSVLIAALRKGSYSFSVETANQDGRCNAGEGIYCGLGSYCPVLEELRCLLALTGPKLALLSNATSSQKVRSAHRTGHSNPLPLGPDDRLSLIARVPVPAGCPRGLGLPGSLSIGCFGLGLSTALSNSALSSWARWANSAVMTTS